MYLSSFSKTLAPGFRVAWIVAPEAICAKCDVAKQAMDLCSGALDQRLVHRALAGGVLERQAPMLRERYQAKRTVMQRAIARELSSVVACAVPRGGFFLWATLPEAIDADALLPRALQAAVTYVSGRAFFVDGTGSNTMRLAFSQPSHERIEEGVARLAGVIRAELDAQCVPSAESGTPVPRG